LVISILITGIKFFLSFIWDLVLGIQDFLSEIASADFVSLAMTQRLRGVKESLPSRWKWETMRLSLSKHFDF